MLPNHKMEEVQLIYWIDRVTGMTEMSNVCYIQTRQV